MVRRYFHTIQHLARATVAPLRRWGIKAIVELGARIGPSVDILILDDIFPHPLSPFRLEEFTTYLRHWPNALVYSTATAFPLVGEHRSFEEVTAEFERNNPSLQNKVVRFSRRRPLNPRLAYVVFMHNTHAMLPFLEERNIPFVFTLYPGGGFALNNESSDATLRRIFNSPLFRHVFVTQNLTRDYLIENNFCTPAQITLVYGVVMPTAKLEITGRYTHKYYATEKETFDICFVAHKYTPRGVDKGYDVFIEVAHLLTSQLPHVHFHVVGNFTPEDIDVSTLPNITFYGTRQTDFFPEFYAGMDLIISPNAAFRLLPGAFDGFPTGSCVEAGLCGVALMCTDELGQNIYLRDGEDIIFITSDVQEIAAKISYFYTHPAELQAIAKAGQLHLRSLFSPQAQMQPRIDLLHQFTDAPKATAPASLNN